MEQKSHSLQGQKKEQAFKSSIMWIVSSSLISFFLFSCSKKNNFKTPDESFKFNLPREISSLDPLLLRGTAKRFVLFNIHRGLYFYNSENKLKPHGAASCEWKTPLVLKCKLSGKKWSDGSVIESKDYLNTYKIIKNQKEESLEALKNIKKVEAENLNTLIFYLKQSEKNFVHRLSDVMWSPRKEEKLYHKKSFGVYSGPYSVLKLSESFILLENNKHYDDFKRPFAKGVFVDEPSAALNLYNVGRIDFLRYLETSNVPFYPKRYMTPFARLDGVFFNPKHLKDINLRKSLFHALNFTELQKIFSSPTLPGCSSLPAFFFKEKRCYEFNLELAKKSFKKVSKLPKKIQIYIPSVTSDEHQKLAQWMKENWRKHLGLKTEISPLEHGVFYEKVRRQELGVYRKAIPLSTLTCSEAKSLVKTQPEFAAVKISSKDLSCDQFFKEIHKMYIRLPLGMPSFAHLHAKGYSGYYINMLGQFGLEKLKTVD